MTLPSLRHCDRGALAQQIQTLVARAQEARPRSASAPAPPAAVKASAAPPAPIATTHTIAEPAEDEFTLPELELSTTAAPDELTEIDFIVDDLKVDPMSIEIESDALDEAPSLETEDDEDELLISIDHIAQSPKSARRAVPDDAVDAEVHAAEIALVQAMADAKLAAELDRVRAEAADLRAAELARIEKESAALREAAVAEARLAAGAEAREALNTELARVRAEAESKLSDELTRVLKRVRRLDPPGGRP